jgi:DNA-binding response OmpR family regulator
MAEVMLVRWPEDASDGVELARSGVAVLYLVRDDADPPVPNGCLEDWIRIPGDESDLSARLAALERRVALHESAPRVDEDGWLHYHGRQLRLPVIEARVARTLIEHFESVVTDADLAPLVEGPSASLRASVAQLRLRLRPLNLAIRRIRRSGYVLSRTES